MHWLDNHGLAERECRTGWEYEALVGKYLEAAGLQVEAPPKTWRATVEDRHDYTNEVDLVADGLRLSVKSRRVTFTDPSDIPGNRDPLFVDTVRKWHQLQPWPAAVVCVSQETNAMIWLPVSSFERWGTKNAFDHVRGFWQDFYTAPATLWQPISTLVPRVRTFWDGAWNIRSGRVKVEDGVIRSAPAQKLVGMRWRDAARHATVEPVRVTS